MAMKIETLTVVECCGTRARFCLCSREVLCEDCNPLWSGLVHCFSGSSGGEVHHNSLAATREQSGSKADSSSSDERSPDTLATQKVLGTTCNHSQTIKDLCGGADFSFEFYPLWLDFPHFSADLSVELPRGAKRGGDLQQPGNT